MAKSFIESPSMVNELASQTVLPSTSGKDMESSKDTHPAPSQGDESKSEPDSKRKDVSIDPSPNQQGETDTKENPDNNSQFEQENDQEDETDPKVPIRDNHAYPECSWSISSKGCQLQGVEPKDVCGVDGC